MVHILRHLSLAENTDVKMIIKYIYNGILLSHKRNEIMPLAATWMDLEIITYLSEVSQKEKDKYHMISLICGF